MPQRQEICLKIIVLLAAGVALLGSAILLLVGTVANGSAISDVPFSWTLFAFILLLTGTQIWLSIAGCKSAWGWINRWNDEVTERKRVGIELN